MKNFALMACLACAASGCATYNYAEQVKMVSFSDDLTKGMSVGNIRGEDCTWEVLGYQMGGPPTLDHAFINAKGQIHSAGIMNDSKGHGGESLRYVNNAHAQNDGFNAGLFGKKCIVVTGLGYK